MVYVCMLSLYYISELYITMFMVTNGLEILRSHNFKILNDIVNITIRLNLILNKSLISKSMYKVLGTCLRNTIHAFFYSIGVLLTGIWQWLLLTYIDNILHILLQLFLPVDHKVYNLFITSSSKYSINNILI